MEHRYIPVNIIKTEYSKHYTVKGYINSMYISHIEPYSSDKYGEDCTAITMSNGSIIFITENLFV